MTISPPILHKLLESFTFLAISVGWILQTCLLVVGISLFLLHRVFSPCKVPDVCLNTFFRNLWHAVTLGSSVYKLPLFKNNNFSLLFCCLQFKMQLSSFLIFCSCSFQKSVLNQFSENFHFLSFRYSHCLACVILVTHYYLYVSFECTLAIIFTVANPDHVEFNGKCSFHPCSTWIQSFIYFFLKE